jgi:hypothetical protein
MTILNDILIFYHIDLNTGFRLMKTTRVMIILMLCFFANVQTLYCAADLEEQSSYDNTENLHTIITMDNYSGVGNNFNYRRSSKSENSSFFWISAGIGIGTVGPSVSGSGNISFQWDANVISARGVLVGVSVFQGQTLWDIGLLYGRATSDNDNVAFASIAVGLAFVQCSGSFAGNIPISNTVGIPVEVQLFLRGRQSGIGIYGFANINPTRSFAGVTLSLQLGKLR